MSQPQVYSEAKDAASAPSEGVILPPTSSDNSNLAGQPSASGAGAEHVGRTGPGEGGADGNVGELFEGKPTAGQMQAARDADPNIPAKASDAPIMGVPPHPDVPFAEQVKGNAKYYAGKITGNDEEVQLGAAKLRGQI